MKTPFPVNPYLTGIVMAYKNAGFIADEVLPRKAVGGRLYKYGVISLDQYLTAPNTLVGRKSQPNEVEFNATEMTGSVEDYGLDDVVPIDDINAAANGTAINDPLGVASEGITELVLLDREIRTSNIVMNAATYPAANKLAITAKWTVSGTDILGTIRANLTGLFIRPNTVVFGADAWNAFSTHPQVVAAAFPAAAAPVAGALQADQASVARLLGVQKVLVGEAWKNGAQLGQATSLTRIWPDSVAFLYLNPNATPKTGLTFGWTAQYGTRVSGDIPEPKIGLRGSIRVRVGESVNENVTAPGAGFLFYDVV